MPFALFIGNHFYLILDGKMELCTIMLGTYISRTVTVYLPVIDILVLGPLEAQTLTISKIFGTDSRNYLYPHLLLYKSWNVPRLQYLC